MTIKETGRFGLFDEGSDTLDYAGYSPHTYESEKDASAHYAGSIARYGDRVRKMYVAPVLEKERWRVTYIQGSVAGCLADRGQIFYCDTQQEALDAAESLRQQDGMVACGRDVCGLQSPLYRRRRCPVRSSDRRSGGLAMTWTTGSSSGHERRSTT